MIGIGVIDDKVSNTFNWDLIDNNIKVVNIINEYTVINNIKNNNNFFKIEKSINTNIKCLINDIYVNDITYISIYNTKNVIILIRQKFIDIEDNLIYYSIINSQNKSLKKNNSVYKNLLNKILVIVNNISSTYNLIVSLLAKKEYIKSAEQLDKERREKIKDHIFLFNLLVKKLILASFLFYMFMNWITGVFIINITSIILFVIFFTFWTVYYLFFCYFTLYIIFKSICIFF